ncbi:hypothetical protein ACIQUS_09785 [Pseudomonas sp. NPDC090755]|uniref:hypothetical protein n=1 Tax=Pseudomonas sp. NPDC090755 TaxID=3364481 RepID=UPI00383AD81B
MIGTKSGTAAPPSGVLPTEKIPPLYSGQQKNPVGSQDFRNRVRLVICAPGTLEFSGVVTVLENQND